MKSQIPGAAILLALIALEGTAALAVTLFSPSETTSAVLFGLSLLRLFISGAMVMAIVFLGILAGAARSRPAWWQRTAQIAGQVTDTPARTFMLLAGMFALLLSVLAVLILSVSPASSELVILHTILNRIGPLLVYAALILIQLELLLISRPIKGKITAFLSSPARAGILMGIATVVYVVTLKVFLAATWDTRFGGLERYIFLPAGILLIWGIIDRYWVNKRGYAGSQKLLMILFIAAASYTLYWHTAQWVRMEHTISAHTWPMLVQSFLNGKLYLENPPTTHDLTFYNGHWYIPAQPLPALVLLPFAAAIGIENINMVQFTILCGVINVVLVYFMLTTAAEQKMIAISPAGTLWLTALFAFGTVHWWLAIYGIYWYFSHILTVLFSALAVVFSIKKSSPWYVGLSLGIAMLARPNVFTLWPFLAGIWLYLEQQEHGRINWRRLLTWSLATAVPMALCMAGLLAYNYARFHNFFDFGYVAVNSADWIMKPVQQYGMFNIHFLPKNFQAMFLKMPFIGLANGKLYYSPGFEGTSILAMTPAILYLFRRFQKNWWTAGAWASVACTAGLLLLYSNTGSWQLGYRYLMDFVLPAVLLIALGVGQKTSRVFVLLTLISILINGANIRWWFTHM